MKRFRVLTAALCAAVLLCGFTPATAYAGGGEDWEGLDPVEPAVTEEPVIEPGEGFSEDGNLVTRDLLYDKHRLTRAHREKQLKMSCQALHNAPPNRT